MNKSKKKLEPKFKGEVMVGDWYSFTNYLKVKKLSKESIEV